MAKKSKRVERRISNLEKMTKKLSPSMKRLFDRHFEVGSAVGEAVVRKPLQEWVIERFGSLSAIENQRVVRIDNILTGEGVLFNELRTKRPMTRKPINLAEKVETERKKCDFCPPLKQSRTLIDTLTGNMRYLAHGNECFVISNLTKYDARHSQIIFPAKHNPHQITRTMVRAWIAEAQEWYKRVHRKDPEALFPIFGLNILWKAGASIIHPHPHIIVARKKHYPKVVFLNRLWNEYKGRYNSDYFDDLYQVHRTLGIADETNGVRVLSSLVPRKEKEIVVLTLELSPHFSTIIYCLIDCFIRKLCVQSFNLVILFAPLEQIKGWEGFPIIAYFLDRGDLTTPTNDFGLMEVYLSSVVASDPFEFFPVIQKEVKSKVSK